MTSRLTADIESLRVSATNPASSYGSKDVCNGETNNGMDFERCIALHNAIVRHGWTARGHKLAELSERTYWERWKPSLTPYQSERLQDRLHPSVLAFFQNAIELPDFYPGSFEPPVFFYHLVGLTAPCELFAGHEDIEGDRYITLYSLQCALATEGKMPGGLVYDQLLHKCILIKDIEESPALDLDERDLHWQPLETVLTAYCEMIETDKVVAFPKNVKGPEPFEYVRHPAGGYAMREMPDVELRDPRTGAKRTKKSFDPWVMVPFTMRDVDMALEAWNRLVEGIEARLPRLKRVKCERHEKLYSLKVLERAGLRREGFAFGFLSQAVKSSVTKIAPGLRLLSSQEFIHQPFQDVTLKRACSTPPIHLLRGANLGPKNGRPDTGGEGPPGLYLERCDPDDAFPFEDAVKAVFPPRSFQKGNGENKIGLLDSDGTCLFQSGAQLHVILERFAKLVESGQWTVGPDGVEGDMFELCTS